MDMNTRAQAIVVVPGVSGRHVGIADQSATSRGVVGSRGEVLARIVGLVAVASAGIAVTGAVVLALAYACLRSFAP